MSRWKGTMPTSYLNDHQIRPREYVKWVDAKRQFARRDKDRETVEKYKLEIQRGGLREPILLGVSDRYPDVYIGDGHHRAIACMQLGVDMFPFHWYWIRSFGVRRESAPFPFQILDPAADHNQRWRP